MMEYENVFSLSTCYVVTTELSVQITATAKGRKTLKPSGIRLPIPHETIESVQATRPRKIPTKNLAPERDLLRRPPPESLAFASAARV